MPDPNATPPMRLGYQGSPHTATRLLRLGGLTEQDVELVAYPVVDPFGPLLTGKLDVMITKFTLQDPALCWSQPLAYEPRAVVVRANHPLAAHDAVSIEDAAAYDVFERPGAFPPYIWDAVVPRRTPGGRELRRRHRAETVPEMMAMVASSDAIHVSIASLADVAPPSIRVVPIYDLPAAPVMLAWQRDAHLPSHVRRFIEAAQMAAADVGTLRAPVALIDALPLQGSIWRAQERELTALGVPVIAFDCRGGRRRPLSGAPASLDVLADDLVRELDARKLDRIVLVGSSLGGYVAMAFQRRHPDRVAGLALLAVRANAGAPAASTGSDQRATFLDYQTPASESASALVGATTLRKRPAVLAQVLNDAAAADPGALAWAARAMAELPDSVRVLRTAQVPAIVIAGDEDRLVHLEDAQLVASALPRGRLIRIPDAGHLPALETPEVVTSALVELLRDVDRAETARRQAR